MIVSSSILDGFRQQISDKVFSFWGHIHVTDISINSTVDQKPMSRSDIVGLDTLGRVVFDDYDEREELVTVASRAGVSHVENFVLAPALLKTKTEFGAVMLKGIDTTYDTLSRQDIIVEGRHLDVSKDNEILVSTIMARQLKFTLGQRILLNTISKGKEYKKVFKIVGIYNTGLEEYDDRFAFVPIGAAQRILDWGREDYSGVAVYLKDARDIDIFNQYIYSVLPPNLYAESIQEKFASIFEWLKLMDVNMVVILVLMIIVSIINMITFLLIYIVERSQMIGVLSSIGARRWQVQKIFIYNGIYIILIGLLIGNILGIGLCLAQDYFKLIPLDEKNYYLSQVPIYITWWKVLGLNLLCFAVTSLFLLVPTLLIAKISPVKVLRFG